MTALSRLSIALRRAAARLARLPPQLLFVPPAAVLIYLLALLPFTPSVDDLRKAKTEQASVMLAADGMVLAEFKGLHREWQPLRNISPQVVAALIATEDHRFYSHYGIDVWRTAGAFVSTLTGERQGGSTITQQLARNAYPEEIGRSATLTRKVKEAWTALKLEARYSKPEILEHYLNTVPFLYNAFGIEMAARTYFGKPAAQLDVLESATLIGMLKGTSYYNPVLNPKRALQRRNLVLTQMARHGKLAERDLAQLQARPLRLNFEQQRQPPGIAPHLAQHVRSWLVEWADRKGYDIHADGLVVRTTLNGPMQLAANEAVKRQMARLDPVANRASGGAQALQAGFMALDPRDGRVRAWVGSRDFATDQFDHVQQARRQPGSTFKPFVYGAAFQKGMQPADTLRDEALEIKVGRGEVWRPVDVTPPTGQPMTLADGLAFSRNTITAQLMMKVGPPRVAQLAQAMGVRTSKLDPVPALALGASPVTLKEMVTSYGTIASGGKYREPIVIMRIEDRSGRVLETLAPPEADVAMQREHALMLVDALRAAVDRGTARAIRTVYGIKADVAGKTGTTQENADGWFILMHPYLVGGAWVGFNDSRIKMGDSWGPGASSALPIVAEVFQHALKRAWIDPRARLLPRDLPAADAEAIAGMGGWLARMFGNRRDAASAADGQPDRARQQEAATTRTEPALPAQRAEAASVFPPAQARSLPAEPRFEAGRPMDDDGRRQRDQAEERIVLRERIQSGRGRADFEREDADDDDNEDDDDDRKGRKKGKKEKHKNKKKRGKDD